MSNASPFSVALPNETGGTFELIVGQLPRAATRVVSFKGTESLSRLYRFDIVFQCQDAPADLEPDVLARAATLVLHVQGHDPRSVRGVVSRCAFRGMARDGWYAYEIRLVPRMWMLSRAVRSRIFQDMHLKDIVGAVMLGMGVPHRWQTRRPSPRRGYCVQYQETDYAFVD